MKDKILKIYRSSGWTVTSEVPVLHMQGKWLELLGFHIGDHYKITVSNGSLVITPISGTNTNTQITYTSRAFL